MKISFCTTCMGRVAHLAETLPRNVADNAKFDGVEFVILDYNSQDGLEAWMQGNMASQVSSGLVAYYRERTAKFFNPRHAKNVAHLLASGDVVVNLDADNFTGPDYAAKVADVFSELGVFLRADQVGRPKHQTGIAGRVAFRAEDFRRLRGYDEVCHGYGGDDPDLVHRAHLLGLRKILLTWPGEDVIQHSNLERTKNFGFGAHEDVSVSGWRNKQVWTNRLPGEIVNPSGFGAANVYKGFSDVAIRVGAESA